jgi:hypothetical protein
MPESKKTANAGDHVVASKFRKVSICTYDEYNQPAPTVGIVQFAFDVLLQNKQINFNANYLSVTFSNIANQNIFTQSLEIFYRPYRIIEAIDMLRRKRPNKSKPCKFGRRVSSFVSPNVVREGTLNAHP